MTKSKSSTIAIVVLSVLLAAALASTIVLAAFSQSKEATTTITFGNGITLNVTGITEHTTDTYSWDVTGATLSSGSVTINGDAAVSLDQISVQVAGMDAYVAIKATVSVSGGTGSDTITPSYTGMIAANTVANADDSTGASAVAAKTGWMVVGSGTNATKLTDGSPATPLVNSTEIFNPGGDSNDKPNDFAGRKYTGTIKIVASDTLSGLAALMTD